MGLKDDVSDIRQVRPQCRGRGRTRPQNGKGHDKIERIQRLFCDKINEDQDIRVVKVVRRSRPWPRDVTQLI
jgi:hypothetical protein